MHLSIKSIIESTSCKYILYTRGAREPELVHYKVQFGPPVSNEKCILKNHTKKTVGKDS